MFVSNVQYMFLLTELTGYLINCKETYVQNQFQGLRLRDILIRNEILILELILQVVPNANEV